MDRTERKLELHYKGYNCGQIITALIAEKGGWDETACADLANMCESCGEICGTLRGGDYCINKYCRETAARENDIPVSEIYDQLEDEKQTAMMLKAKGISKMMYERFRERNGSLFCSDLRTDNMMESCAKYVDDVVDILEELF